MPSMIVAPGPDGRLLPPAPARIRRRSDVQGMRALAVSAVVLYHAGVPRLSGGYVGVDVFFVISGFVITNLLLSELDVRGRVSVLAFYGRRAQRIIPLAAVVIGATVLASYYELGFLRAGRIAVDGQWAAFFGANIHFANEGTDYLGSQLAPSPLQHYWSLSVEEQFYVVWPLLLWLLFRLGGTRVQGSRRHLRPVLAGAVAIMLASYAWSVTETSSNQVVAYFSTLTRACELMAGAVVALVIPSIRALDRRVSELLGILGLAAIAFACFALDGSTAFPGAVVAIPVVGAACLLVAGAGASVGHGFVTERILSSPVLVLVGDLSFSLYLWHWPILIIAQQSQSTPLSVTARVLLIWLAFVLSMATYWLLENPVRKSGWLKRRPAVSVGIGVALVLTVFLGLVGVVTPSSARRPVAVDVYGPPTGTASTPGQAPRLGSAASTSNVSTVAGVQKLVAQARTITAVPSDLDPPLTQTADDGAPPCPVGAVTLGPGNYCVYGDTSATKTMALLGDSHAGEWTYALAMIAQHFGYKLYRFSLPACPAPNVHFIAPQTNQPNTDCDTYHALAEAKIKSLDPDILVVTSSTKQLYDAQRRLVTPAAWQAGLESTLNVSRGPDTRMFVLGDYAYLPVNGADCLAAHQSDVQSCSVPVSGQAAGTLRAAEEPAARAVGATYIDTMPWVCSTSCTAVIGHYLVYKDLYHLSEAYTEYLTGALSQSLGLTG